MPDHCEQIYNVFCLSKGLLWQNFILNHSTGPWCSFMDWKSCPKSEIHSTDDPRWKKRNHVPNQQPGQALFHRTPLHADEVELVDQSEIAPRCTPALKTFISPPTTFLRQHWLDQKCARKHLNPCVTYIREYFLFNVCLILILTSKGLRGFPHYAPESTWPLRRYALCGSRKHFTWHSMVPMLWGRCESVCWEEM